MKTVVNENSFSQNNQLEQKERLSYAFTNFGQTMIYGLMGAGILQIFLTDALKIPPIAIGLFFVVARVFDGVCDIVMRRIVDRTRTNWGKCRSYMLLTPVPVALLALLIFVPFEIPSLGITMFISFALFLLFTLFYTANDIPYGSMSVIITTNPNERLKLVALTRIIGGFGSTLFCTVLFWPMQNIFATLLEPGIAKEEMSEMGLAYLIPVVIICIIGVLLMLQGFFYTKERIDYKEKQDKEEIFANIKLVVKNKPMLINLIAGLLGGITTVGTTIWAYFSKYNLAGVANVELFGVELNSTAIFMPILGLINAMAMLIGLIFVPKLCKWMPKRRLLLLSAFFGGGMNIVAYFIGYSHILIFIVVRFVCCIPFGIWAAITTSMVGDSVDYMEWKIGKRAEGTCFTLLTFLGKVNTGVALLIVNIVLASFGYNTAKFAVTSQFLDGLFICLTLVTAFGMIVSAIPYLFYHFDEEQHAQAIAEINLRNL